MSGMEAAVEQAAGEENLEVEVPPLNAGVRVPWYERRIRIYASSLEEVNRWKDPQFLEAEWRRQIALSVRAADPSENAGGDGGGDVEENGDVGELPGMQRLVANQEAVEGRSFGDEADESKLREQEDGTVEKDSGNDGTGQGSSAVCDLEGIVAKQKAVTEDVKEVDNRTNSGVPFSEPQPSSSAPHSSSKKTCRLSRLSKTVLSHSLKRNKKKFAAGRLSAGPSRKSTLASSTISALRNRIQLRPRTNPWKQIEELVKTLKEKDARNEQLEKLLKEKDLQLKTGTCFDLGGFPSGTPAREERKEGSFKDSGNNHVAGTGGIVEKDTRERATDQDGESSDLEETGGNQKTVMEGGDPEGRASLERSRDVTESKDNQKNADVQLSTNSSCDKTTGVSKSDEPQAGPSGTSSVPCNQNIRRLTRSQKKEALRFAKWSPGPTRKNALTNPLLLSMPTPNPVQKRVKCKASVQSESVERNKTAGAEGSKEITETGIEMKGAVVGGMPRQRRFQCIRCNLLFPSKKQLKRHVDTKHEGKKFACRFCGMAFSQSNNLGRHLKTQHKYFGDNSAKDFTCKICDRICGTRHSLRDHLKMHTEEKPYSCHVCPKSFSRNADLTRHLAIHEGNKPFQCQFCGQAFHQKSNLEAHQRRMHSFLGSKRPQDFTCPVCNKISGNNWALKVHMKTWSCPKCSVKLRCFSKVREHMEEVHKPKRRFSCEVCGKKFVQKEYKDEHMWRQHAPAEIAVHLKSGAVKGVTCLFCEKVFATRGILERHMKGHTEEKPLIGSVCYREFSHEKNLRNHKKKNHEASDGNADKRVALSRNTGKGGVGEKTASNNSLSEEVDVVGDAGGNSLLDQYQLGLVSPCDEVNEQVPVISAEELKRVIEEETGSGQNFKSDAASTSAQTSFGSVGSILAKTPGGSFSHETATKSRAASTSSRKRNVQVVKSQQVRVTKKRMKNDASTGLLRTTRGTAKLIPSVSNPKPV